MKNQTLSITEGSKIQGGSAVVVSIDEKRIVVRRMSTGSTVNVSRALVEKTRQRFANGETVRVHANGPQGGISYTSTVEHTVLAALGGAVKTGKTWALLRA